MELTAKLIEEAEFRETFRGYDRDQVDDFLEKVAGGVEELTKRLSALDSGLARPPAASAAPPPPAAVPVDPTPTLVKPAGPDPKALEDNTDELRRTLILAQRTADAAIREAKEEAARLVAEARDSTTRQIAEADAKAKKLVADAEVKAASIVAEAERQAEEHRTSNHQRLQGEISALEGTREQLRSDANLIDRHVEEQRQQLRGALTELQRLIDDPQGFRLNPPPPVQHIAPPVLGEPDPIGPPPTAESVSSAAPDAPAAEAPVAEEPVAEEPAAEAPAGEAPSAEQADEPTPEPSSQSAATPSYEPATPPTYEAAAELPLDVPSPAAEPESMAASAEPVDAPSPEPAGQATDGWSSLRDENVVDLTIPDPDDITTAGGQAEPEADDAADDADSGEPTQAVPQLKGDADEDAFLAELRKAMTDEEPLGPRDDNTTIPTRSTVDPMSEEHSRSRPRFGRRR